MEREAITFTLRRAENGYVVEMTRPPEPVHFDDEIEGMLALRPGSWTRCSRPRVSRHVFARAEEFGDFAREACRAEFEKAED